MSDRQWIIHLMEAARAKRMGTILLIADTDQPARVGTKVDVRPGLPGIAIDRHPPSGYAPCATVARVGLGDVLLWLREQVRG